MSEQRGVGGEARHPARPDIQGLLPQPHRPWQQWPRLPQPQGLCFLHGLLCRPDIPPGLGHPSLALLFLRLNAIHIPLVAEGQLPTPLSLPTVVAP